MTHLKADDTSVCKTIATYINFRRDKWNLRLDGLDSLELFDGNPFCSQVASYFGDDAHEESYKVRLFSSKVVAIDTRSR